MRRQRINLKKVVKKLGLEMVTVMDHMDTGTDMDMIGMDTGMDMGMIDMDTETDMGMVGMDIGMGPKGKKVTLLKIRLKMLCIEPWTP